MGRIVHGTHRPRDASSMGRTVQGTQHAKDASAKGCYVQGTDHLWDSPSRDKMTMPGNTLFPKARSTRRGVLVAAFPIVK